MRTHHEIEVDGEFVDIEVTWLVENETDYYEVGNITISRPYEIITPLIAESKDDVYYFELTSCKMDSFEQAVEKAYTDGNLNY